MTLVRHYDAATANRGMASYILPLFGYPALIWRNRYMIHNFLRRELMGRFHGSFLGIWWILAQPLFQFAVYFAVFGMIFGNWKFGDPPDVGFAIYLFSGVIVFHSLLEATSQCCSIVVANGNLVKKVAFPSEVLVIPTVLTSLVLYLVGATVCFVGGWIGGVMSPGPLLLALPLVLLLQLVFTTGLGLLLANLDVFVRDTSQMWRIVTMAWMFLTPVFWEPNKLLEMFPPEYASSIEVFAHLNPAHSLLMAHRLALGLELPKIDLGDFWTHIGFFALWSTFFILLGYTAFMSRKHKFADLV
jgi:lipopolysaccharide transport system permease protein